MIIHRKFGCVTEKPCRVSFFKKKNRESFDIVPLALYTQYPIAIKKAKAQDLKKLIGEYVPLKY